MFLSIVIPVYNAEKHIKKCLDSIWAQELNSDEFEVVCVDDCSKDNTQEVLQNIAQEHSNLKIFKNETNRRAGGSRNRGVKNAKGRYIVFIDADDYFHEFSLKKVLDIIKDNNCVDIILCDFAREQVGARSDKPVHKWGDKRVINGRDFMLNNGVPWGPCQYIFKKSIMIDNNIYFEENVSAEDVDWSHNLVLHTKQMQYKPILLSHYVLHDVSQTANEFRNFRLIDERMFAGYRLNKLALLYKDDKKLAAHLNNVATSFFNKALQFMTAIYCNARVKSNTINKYITVESNNRLVGFAKKNPLLFAYISNITSPFIKLVIVLKRSIKGR